jgi:hypothetical protein
MPSKLYTKIEFVPQREHIENEISQAEATETPQIYIIKTDTNKQGSASYWQYGV